MAAEHPEFIEQERPARRWLVPLSWSLLVSIALVVYELTDQTGLAAAIGCGKFGWKDFRTAWWLRRTDPNRGRGKTCFWFYVSSGLWKITLAAFVVLAIIVAAEEWIIRRPPQQAQAIRHNPPATFKGGAITLTIGLVLGVVTSHVALWSALRRRCRIWLDFAVHRAREEGVWPPPYRRWNLAGLLLTVTMGITETAFFVAVIWLAASLLPLGIVTSLLLVATFFGIVFLGPRLTDPLLERAVAQSPEECWGSNGPDAESANLSA